MKGLIWVYLMHMGKINKLDSARFYLNQCKNSSSLYTKSLAIT